MPDNDQAYKDEAAPAGSPFRPLYHDRILFNGQPIALVVAETPEIARFAASLVRVEYDRQEHATDLHGRRDRTVAPPPATNPMEAVSLPPKPRGTPD
jgi:xanthine dehydrogenase YagR molybdenum-binding subunit